MSFQYATGMCLLLENVGGSEQNRSVANVQSDDLWPSRMHATRDLLANYFCCYQFISGFYSLDFGGFILLQIVPWTRGLEVRCTPHHVKSCRFDDGDDDDVQVEV